MTKTKDVESPNREGSVSSRCSSSYRSGLDFCFRVWDGKLMSGWGVTRQSHVSLHKAFNERDLVVMQRTPWMDSVGNEIYEGDVLEFDSSEWGSECRFVMEWENGEWSHIGTHSDLPEWCTVIGNIHEQPELTEALCS